MVDTQCSWIFRRDHIITQFMIKEIYLTCYGLFWWVLFGYYFFLFVGKNLRKTPTCHEEITQYPTISVLVPCYNEEKLVESKLKNLANLRYPTEKLEIIFLDGCSADGTISRIERLAKDIPNIRVVETNRRGKILQINCLLPEITSDFIVNTDMDALVTEDALLEVVKEFQTDQTIGVVGGLTIPLNCLPEDAHCWWAQNRIRMLESLVYSSSTVIATFYAFRNGVVKSFPEDVVADDVYLPLMANIKRLKAIYSPNIVVYETRTPTALYDLLRHKFRKANAHLGELLRFFRFLPKMQFCCKVSFVSRLLLILCLPWATMVLIVLTIYLLSTGNYSTVLWCLGISVISMWAIPKIMPNIKSPQSEMRYNVFLNLKTFLIIFSVLCLVSITYPFYTQTSSYEKVGKK